MWRCSYNVVRIFSSGDLALARSRETLVNYGQVELTHIHNVDLLIGGDTVTWPDTGFWLVVGGWHIHSQTIVRCKNFPFIQNSAKHEIININYSCSHVTIEDLLLQKLYSHWTYWWVYPKCVSNIKLDKDILETLKWQFLT